MIDWPRPGLGAPVPRAMPASVLASQETRATLIGETTRDRPGSIDGLRALARGERVGDEILDTVRRTLVEVLLHEDRARLVIDLDDAMLGLRSRPAGYFSARASAA